MTGRNAIWIVAGVTGGVFLLAVVFAQLVDGSSKRDRDPDLRAHREPQAIHVLPLDAGPADAATGPSLTLGTPNADDPTDVTDVRNVLETERTELLDCYLRALAEDPSIGAVTIDYQWYVETDGTISPGYIDGGPYELQSCIKDVLARQRFHITTSSEEVELTFSPGPTSTDAAVYPPLGGTTPDVVIDEPIVDAGLDADAVHRVLDDAQPKLLACYQTALLSDPSLEGALSSYWQVDRKGKAVGQTTNGVELDLDDCVDKVIAKLRFPHPSTGDLVGVDDTMTFLKR